jgi:quercetin 2,3-dioxygenase
MKTNSRELTTVYAPPSHPGFLGAGHIARPVIQVDFKDSDPFIVLMDDMLHKTDYQPSGGPHPHGGFETVSLLLEGEMGDEEHGLRAGELEIMTAGSGIVHTETIEKPTKLRLLQLWLNLPKEKRKASPRVQKLRRANAPVSTVNGVTTKVYSGNFAGLKSPMMNHTPLIVAELILQPSTSFQADLPSDYSSFIYAIEGASVVGEQQKRLNANEVGWLDRAEVSGNSSVKITAGSAGAHVVLYAAQPQRHEIVSHGPFIADSMEDIRQLYSDFRSGKIQHIDEVSAEQQFVY